MGLNKYLRFQLLSFFFVFVFNSSLLYAQEKEKETSHKSEKQHRAYALVGLGIFDNNQLSAIFSSFSLGYTYLGSSNNIFFLDFAVDIFPFNRSATIWGAKVGTGLSFFKDSIFSPSIGIGVSYYLATGGGFTGNTRILDFPLYVRGNLRLSDSIQFQIDASYFLRSIPIIFISINFGVVFAF